MLQNPTRWVPVANLLHLFRAPPSAAQNSLAPRAPSPAGNGLHTALGRGDEPTWSRVGSWGRSCGAPGAGDSSPVSHWPGNLPSQTRLGPSWPAPSGGLGPEVSRSGSWRSVVSKLVWPLGSGAPHSPGPRRAEPRRAACEPRGPSGAGKRRPKDSQDVQGQRQLPDPGWEVVQV